MTCSWSVFKLKDVVEFVTDKIEASSITAESYISTDNMLINKGGVEIAEKLPNAKKFNSFQVGDTLFSNIRPYFEKVWFADFSGGASADILIFRSKNTSILLPDYLYYFLSSPEFIEFTVRTSKGAKMPRGDKGAMMEFELRLPPVQLQAIVAKSLRALDCKKRINIQINQTLEEIAQAIFKSWFVDFDLVKAKMNGEQPEEMDESTASFFPDKLVESELGLIPEGWEIKSLEQLAEFQNGFAFYTTGYSDEGYSVVDLGNISKEGKFIQTSHDKYVSEEIYHLPKHKKHHLNKDDLVMAMTDMTQAMGILGKTGKIPESDKYILNQRVGKIRCKPNVDVNFMLTNLNSRHQLHFLKARALGTVQKYVNTNHIKEMKFIIPCDSLMQKFGELVKPLFERIYVNDLQNLELEKLRDTLLPKLLSGEMELGELEVKDE